MILGDLMRNNDNLYSKEIFEKMHMYHYAKRKKLFPSERLYVVQISEG
jgi:hypothetical protein